MKKNTYLLLILLIVIGGFLRFYNLNWGAPFYFHPDERNIASSVSQLTFPTQMNPHFFAYSSLPIYAIYFIGVLINFLTHFSSPISHLPFLTVSFEQAIIISRFFSASFSLLLIPLMFFIGKKLKGTSTGLIAALLTLTSTGLIQYAHFGTFEMWLTFFTVILFWFCLKMLDTRSFFNFISLGIVFGILIAIKISHVVLLPIPILTLFFYNSDNLFGKSHITRHLKRAILFFYTTILFIYIVVIVYFLTNPFVMLDYSSFIGSMKYESGVALGTLPVFYTGEFIHAVPIVFQFLHIYPFLLNPFMTILFIPSFFCVLFISIKQKHKQYLILNTFFLILFLSQAFLYAKWTRYMMPTLPFIYLICAIAFVDFLKVLTRHVIARRNDDAISLSTGLPRSLSVARNDNKLENSIFKTASEYLLLSILVSINFLFAVSYFETAFVHEDTRLAAKNFAKQYMPSSAPILSEVYDLGITPFNDSFSSIKLFNYYELDNKSLEFSHSTLKQQLVLSDYIILPSQRILKTRLQNPKTFPDGYTFYSELLSGTIGFQKIYETPCDLFCRVTYLNNPVWSSEGTANVFDRPTVFIFKKNKN